MFTFVFIIAATNGINFKKTNVTKQHNMYNLRLDFFFFLLTCKTMVHKILHKRYQMYNENPSIEGQTIQCPKLRKKEQKLKQ